jgi:hypothetical protein
MNKERLLVLANFLEKDVPDDQFAMDHWVEDKWQGAQDLSCGAAACALGWAVQVPEFKDLGLYYQRDGSTSVSILMADTEYKLHVDPSMQTAQELFDLSYAEARRLFMPSYYQDSDERHVEVTRQMVADQIREFVRTQIEFDRRTIEVMKESENE